jgi:hypothetical protein
MAVRHQDASCNKKPCRQFCATIFGEPAVEENKDFLHAEILRITQKVREMPADQVAALGNTTEGMTQEDVRGAQCTALGPMLSPCPCPAGGWVTLSNGPDWEGQGVNSLNLVHT